MECCDVCDNYENCNYGKCTAGNGGCSYTDRRAGRPVVMTSCPHPSSCEFCPKQGSEEAKRRRIPGFVMVSHEKLVTLAI